MRAFGEGADDDGFATVFGMIPLFDGREEGVHIDVEDDAIGGQCVEATEGGRGVFWGRVPVWTGGG